MKSTWSKPSLLRDFAILAAAIVFVLSLVSLWVTYETYQDHSERIVKQLENEATRIDRAMILEIEHSSYLLGSLGRQITLMDKNDLKSIALLLRSFDTAATLHHVFSWIDDAHNNVVSSNKGVHPPVDVSDRDYVKMSVAEPWKIQIGVPIQGRVSAKWVLPVALGLTDTTGRYIGTILISMDIDTITRDLRGAVKDSGIFFAVYSSTLVPLTETLDEHTSSPLTAYSEALKSIDFARGPSGLLARGSLFDTRAMYVYYELSANYPYIVLLGYDNKASAISIRDLLIPKLVQILCMGLFIFALLWIVRLRIINPIGELSEVAAGLIRGEPYKPVHTTSGKVDGLANQIRKLGDYLDETRRIEEEKENKNLMLRKNKEAAELSNKIKIEFLTAMSHELRTPLNTIVGFSEIMKSQLYGPLENTQYWQYAQDIHEASRHLQALVDDVLALSNAESGIAELQEKPLDVRFVLNKCLRLVTERLQIQKLHVELKMPDVMPRLLVDEQRLKQIIINLLLNAANHSAEDSHIIVEASVQKSSKGEESFCISFTEGLKPDTGKSAADAGAAKARRRELSNLGIPLTKALVAMHQATLDIERPPGKPIRVVVRFPQERMMY